MATDSSAHASVFMPTDMPSYTVLPMAPDKSLGCAGSMTERGAGNEKVDRFMRSVRVDCTDWATDGGRVSLMRRRCVPRCPLAAPDTDRPLMD